jgi:glyoxylase-like metal-dependent hydrolase (beta-lactamase superfamily II)
VGGIPNDLHTALFELFIAGLLSDRRRELRPGLRIERVIETHIHADFLSGHLELAEATGAAISFGEKANVEFPIEPLGDGQRISLGEVTFEILSTPGHTPESICVVVYEHPDDEVPYGVLTGDTLFVGDVGRPDLCASSGISADELAQLLYRSLHDKLLPLPDVTRVSQLMAPDLRVASRCQVRPVQPSASSERPTTR